MAHFHNPNLAGAGGQGGYLINQSLRFDGATNCYLRNASLGIYGNTNTTISFWLKHSTKQNGNIFACGTNPNLWSLEIGPSSSGGGRWLNNGGTIYVFPDGAGKLRDPAAWYHIVLRQTGNQSTIFVNGVQTNNNNSNSAGTNTGWYIGNEDGAGNNQLDGYLAEFVHVDGTAYAPSYFGEFDSITGAWIPKKISGITYGTKGFYLKFDPSATNGIGHDHSGNGNNFTATGFSTSGTGTDVMSDTPTTNWCTWNPINKGPSAGSYGSQLSDGNLVLAYNRTAGDFYATSTFGLPTTGKWYWEQRLTSTGSVFAVMGIAELNWTWNVSPRVSYLSSGKIVTSPDGSSDAQTGLATYTTGDVIGHAWDADAGTLQFYKNGTAVGNPQAPTTTSGITFAITFNAGSDTGWTTVLNCGQRAFEQTPPTGFKALNTANLPEPTIKKGGAHFNTVLYTGNSSTQSITGVGFQPDWVWAKSRSEGYSHYLYDVVRGAGTYINTNNTDAEYNNTSTLSSFNTDGFSLGSAPGTNNNAQPYVAWNWKANGAGSSNTAGSITSTVSANASAGFSIVTYTGAGSAGTVGHGLGVAPKFLIVKNRSSATAYNWYVWHTGLTSASYFLQLNTTSAQINSPDPFNATAPTSTLFSVGGENVVNTVNYVAYAFSEVAGYSKFGSYTGNGSSDGPFVFCGFRPRWILLKSTSSGSWELYDTARDTYNQSEKTLEPNSSAVEGSGYPIDILSNGFKVRTSNSQINYSSYSYIFAAFAELPAKYSNAR